MKYYLIKITTPEGDNILTSVRKADMELSNTRNQIIDAMMKDLKESPTQITKHEIFNGVDSNFTLKTFIISGYLEGTKTNKEETK